MRETGGFPGFGKPPPRRHRSRARGTTGRARFFSAKRLLDSTLPACRRSLTSSPRVPTPHRLANADVEDFYAQSDPDKENLCLYGNPDGTWEVQLPAEEVPPELPEPALGINFARDGMQVRFPDRRAKDFRSLFTLPLAHFPHPRARRLTPCSRFETAEEGLARARRGTLRRVADGGGVLLRRQVRREGAVRFPGRIHTRSNAKCLLRVPFPKTTLIHAEKAAHRPAPFARAGRNSSSASTRFPRCTRSSPARRPPSPRRTKSPPPWRRYAFLPASPKRSRMSCFAHSSSRAGVPNALPLRSLPRKSKPWGAR